MPRHVSEPDGEADEDLPAKSVVVRVDVTAARAGDLGGNDGRIPVEYVVYSRPQLRAPNIIELYRPQTVSNTSVVANDPCAGLTPCGDRSALPQTGMQLATASCCFAIASERPLNRERLY